MPRSHKTLRRLFVETDLEAPEQGVTLGREQTNYVINVLRMRVGDEVVLFNGRQGAWHAGITEGGKKAASLALIEQIALQPPASQLWYGFAPLKAARLDYMIQKATEMGAGIIQPVITRYTQVARLKPDRLRANAIEAAEQCEVLSIPEIGDEITLNELLDGWPSARSSRMLLFADEAAPSSSAIDALRSLGSVPVGVLIGPEGGFSDEERANLLAKEFVRPISLGPRILRADTAAVAALALVQATIGDWR